MECFILENNVLSGEKIYLCAICESNIIDIENIKKTYLNAMSNADFTGIKDDYFIDIKLYNLFENLSPNSVLALGVGIIIKNSIHIGGGIIGNPHNDKESADDNIEYIENGLWCVALSGRFGVVFGCESKKAKNMADAISEFNNLSIEKAITKTRDYLVKNTDIFIILCDGSGKGAYPYCACFDGKKLIERNYNI